jgi:hypothetical protein
VNTGKINKMLTIYVLDLGLNTVVRLSTESIDETANMLIASKNNKEE